MEGVGTPAARNALDPPRGVQSRAGAGRRRPRPRRRGGTRRSRRHAAAQPHVDTVGEEPHCWPLACVTQVVVAAVLGLSGRRASPGFARAGRLLAC